MKLTCMAIVIFVTLLSIGGCKDKGAPPAKMVAVPSGEFPLGSDEVDREAKAMQYGSTKPWFANENPAHNVSLKEFYIDAYEVTNKDYKEFVVAVSRKAPQHWEGGSYAAGTDDMPVVMVTWHDADAYCKWKGKRLPTEAEWEKAAKGTGQRAFPWGNDFDIKKVNTLGAYNGLTPVGTFKDGVSPYGAYDMAGNAQEWTSDWYKQYPGNSFADAEYGEKFKAVRGGGWGGMGHYALQVYVRTTFRLAAKPDGAYNDVGFRCAWPQ